MKTLITYANIEKDGLLIRIEVDKIVDNIEDFRQELKKKHEAKNVYFCMEDIDDNYEREQN